MKNLILEIEDSTKAGLRTNVEVRYLSDLAGELGTAVDDFVKLNEGVVLPPLSIRVREDGSESSHCFRKGDGAG